MRTFAALIRQRIALVIAELNLSTLRRNLNQRLLHNIPLPVIGKNIVIAAVHRPVVLNRQSIPAGLRVSAETRRIARVQPQQHIEVLHKNLPDIRTHPAVEYPPS